jgi:Helix-turn-helix domain/RDD family
MTPATLAQRLRLARTAYDKDVNAFARLIGIRTSHVHAIEEGRFSDLPSGIYGRSAVKAYAAACGLDSMAVLADAEAWLVSVDDPIVGLARLKGLRPQPSAPIEVAVLNAPREVEADVSSAAWRPLAAALIDAVIVSALLLLVVMAAVAALFVPVSTLDGSSPAFAFMGMLLAAGYFVWFGGVAGATVGERAMHITRPRHHPSRLTLHAIAAGALQSASEDVDCLRGLGARVGRRLALTPPPVYGNDAGMSGR